MKRPDAEVIGLHTVMGYRVTVWFTGLAYRAVEAVLGARMACSIVLAVPFCVPGRRKPDTGRPD